MGKGAFTAGYWDLQSTPQPLGWAGVGNGRAVRALIAGFHVPCTAILLGSEEILLLGAYSRFICLSGAECGPRSPSVLRSSWRNTTTSSLYCCPCFFFCFFFFPPYCFVYCFLLFLGYPCLKNYVIIAPPKEKKISLSNWEGLEALVKNKI